MTKEIARELKLVPQHLVDAWSEAYTAVADAIQRKEIGSMSDDFFYTNGGHARAMQDIRRAKGERDAAWLAIEQWSRDMEAMRDHELELASEIAAEMASERDLD